MFSARTAIDPRPNALSLALDRARARGRPLLDLTTSNPTRAGVPYDAPRDPRLALRRARRSSTPPSRSACRRRARRSRAPFAEHGHDVPPSRVLLTASTSEAYAFLFKLLCDPGDEVLVPQPSYPLFDHLARFEGVTLVPYPLALRRRVARRPRFARPRAAPPDARGAPRLSPNNPTGSYVKARRARRDRRDRGSPS